MQGPITSVQVIDNVLVTSGRDGMLNTWKYSYHMDKLLEIKVVIFSSNAPRHRSMDQRIMDWNR